MKTLALTNQCGSLSGAVALKGNIVEAISQDNEVALDVSGLNDVDLSLLQTIEVARRNVSAQGGELMLSTPANASLREALDRAGFSTSFTAADRSFWFHED